MDGIWVPSISIKEIFVDLLLVEGVCHNILKGENRLVYSDFDYFLVNQQLRPIDVYHC